MTEVAPVTKANRVESLDVMRGLAILGILAVNAPFFAGPWQAGQNPLLPPLDVNQDTLWSWLVMHVFFEFKFITLFSILFGASIFLVGGERSDKDRGAVLRRRLSWMVLFGLIHGALIWFGDILLTYALTGFLVLLCRSWRPRTLMTTGALLLLLSIGMMAAVGALFPMIPADKLAPIASQVWSPPAAELERLTAAMRGGVLSVAQENLTVWSQYLLSGLPFLVVRTAGVMMIGMALFKWGYLSGRSPLWVYGLAVALGAVALALIGWQAVLNAQAQFEFVHMQSRGLLANTALSIFVSVAYAGLMVLLVKAGVRFITGPLAAVGRMAFTNYLTQSLIMTTIFWGGRGFGLYGEVNRVELWGVVIGVWALQLIWSPLWLSRFQMGPMEWVWRRLSYAKPVKM